MRPRLHACLVAPWRAILRPGAAAVQMAGAPLLTALAIMLVMLVLLGVEYSALALWSETVTYTWVPTETGEWTGVVRERSFRDVWREWQWYEFDLGVAGFLILVATIIGLVIWPAAAWLYLPLVHGTGSAWRAYGRTLRGFAVLGGPAAALLAIIGCIYVPVHHAVERGYVATTQGSYAYMADADELLLLFGIPAAIWALIAYARLAARGLGRLSPPPDLPPRCEGCGYDLRHQPESGRCPECGLALAESLDPQVARPGTPWQQGRSLRSWARTFLLILWRPQQAYRRMPMRAARRDDISFAATTYIVLGLVMTAWLVALKLLATLDSTGWMGLLVEPIEELLLDSVLWPAAVVAMASPWIWLVYRVVALVPFTTWALFKSLPDFRWAGRIIAYESAALAIPLGLMMLAMLFLLIVEFAGLFTGMLPAPGFAAPTIFGMPLTTIVMGLFFGPPVVYLIAAAYRYRLARRAVRWSNL